MFTVTLIMFARIYVYTRIQVCQTELWAMTSVCQSSPTLFVITVRLWQNIHRNGSYKRLGKPILVFWLFSDCCISHHYFKPSLWFTTRTTRLSCHHRLSDSLPKLYSRQIANNQTYNLVRFCLFLWLHDFSYCHVWGVFPHLPNTTSLIQEHCIHFINLTEVIATFRQKDVLFSGVRQLIFSAAVVGLLDPRVGPQAFDSCDVWIVKIADLLDVHFLHKTGVGLRRQRCRCQINQNWPVL